MVQGNINCSKGLATTIDGVKFTANMRVLIKNQDPCLPKMVFTVTTAGSGTDTTVLTSYR